MSDHTLRISNGVSLMRCCCVLVGLLMHPAVWAANELKQGEYACYGSGGQILGGSAFKVLPGGRFTDLDDGNAGTYAVSGSEVTFTGGHLDGTVGRELKDGNFRIGVQATCEPF